ncbi:hypothetical protein EST38_g10541 [Candolleomyces aberdarensis]|uniref:Uncharacterized protein n=1 Tax=Candolleomyces aberdarensis TaxID=2316362 RepID=A0A4Q2D746_9AGAR|nr:hypothetical protein EST38_g10541 [Candolleomyces aberdarensis]
MTTIGPAIPLKDQVFNRVGDISREINNTLEQAARIAIKSGNNEQLALFRARFNSLRNASKDVAFEIVTVLKRYKGVALTVWEIASPDARATVNEELKYFVDERYSQSTRTIIEAFLNLRRDFEQFIAGVSSGDLKEQLRVLVQKVNELTDIWNAVFKETGEFREIIATAVEALTNMRLKKIVQIANQKADVIGVSLETYIAAI